MSLQEFEVISKIGDGAYSTVHKVKRLEDGAIYALKKVKLINLSQRQVHNSVNQVRILASIRHPNIIGYKQAFYDSQSKCLCIIMQYADGGDLLQKIFQYKKRGLTFEQDYIWDIFLQVLNGLKALHDLKILHRDIKSENIYLCKNGIAKLGDMNVSKVLKKQSMCQTQTGTPYYASPQVWNDEAYDNKSDLWSLGCVLYEFITLKPPFRAKDMQSLYRKVSRGFYSKIDRQYSEDLSIILKTIIRVNPIERLTCGQLIDHPIIRKRLIKKKQIQVDEKSFLLKTIKLTKNINYLTEKLPKPNYTPLKYKHYMTSNQSLISIKKSSLNKSHQKNLSIQMSLPQIQKKGKIMPVLKKDMMKPRMFSLDRKIQKSISPIHKKLY